MSLEINGNGVNVLRRRKNKDKPGSMPKVNLSEFNNPSVQLAMNSFFPNHNVPENIPLYFPFSYTQRVASGPTSLPVYPFTYPNVPYLTNPTTNAKSNISTDKTFNAFQNNHSIFNNDTNEYMSLPIGNLDQNYNFPDKRRFSDPGIPLDSDSSSNSFDDRLVQKLTQQVNALKENNRKLNREIMEMRIELNMLKQQQMIRHFDRDYEPGMLSEVVKEIRDAARVREDALLAKVKHMIEEKQFNMNQIHMIHDKSRNNERLTKLEEQMKNLSVSQNRNEDSLSLASSLVFEENSNSAMQVIELEREALILRRELQDARAKREESDQKLMQLDKKLAKLLRHKEVVCSDASEDGKASISTDSFSLTTSSIPAHVPVIVPQRVTLTGPVTDL